MNLADVLFYILAALTGISALAVVITQNIVRAATWLLFALAGTAGIFFLLGADFIGATQLLIYVGGTLVLVVFGVMLTAQGPFINMKINAAEWAIAMGVGLLLYGVLAIALVGVQAPGASLNVYEGKPEEEAEARTAGRSLLGSKYLGAALLGDRRATPEARLTGGYPGPKRERSKMSYLLPFEIVSVHLLVVLIGAAYLARAKRKKVGTPAVGSTLATGANG
jgi:NADH-quinone oxidoreductase subunit J